MSQALQIIIMFAAWIAVAIGCHALIKNYYLSSFVAAGVMIVGTEVASYIQLGYLDPFWLMSSITGFFIALLVALIVGLPFKIKRGVRSEDI
jgi:hypothetical protein